jgi:hypothetical protein
MPRSGEASGASSVSGATITSKAAKGGYDQSLTVPP